MQFSRTFTGLALGLMLLSSAQSTVFAASSYYPTYSTTSTYTPTYQTSATTYGGYYYGTSSTAINYVKSHGIMTGYANDGFGENNSVNRAEFATVVMRIYSRTVPNVYTMYLPFYDTAKNAWYTSAVTYAYGNGLMTGYPDNSFRPDNPVAFDEAAKVLAMVYRLNLNSGSSSSQWYEKYVRALSDQNAIPTSITTLYQPLTRGQLADIIYRLDSGDHSQPSQNYNTLVQGYGYGNCGNGKDLQITINPSDNNPNPGDQLSYDIKLQNCSGRTQQIDVTANLDNQVYFSSATEGGYSNGRTVRWNNVNVSDGDSKTITLNTRVDGAGNGDSINLSVNATDNDGNSDYETSNVTVSGSSNCYYDQYNHYICNNNNNNNCYYDSNNNYICNNNNNNNCYYDQYNHYVCNNNNNNCYYNSNGQYICNNNNNCYYDSNNNYICNNNNNNCYYDSNNNYICNNNNNNCYYDQYGHYICNNNNGNGDVSVTINPENGTYVEPGDTVTYDIRIRNNTSTDRHFTMHANFSSDLVYQSASDNVSTSDSQNLNWNDIFISHYQTELVTVKLRVRSTVYNGEPLSINVNTNNGGGSSDYETSTVYVQNANNNNNCYYNSNGQYICNNNNNCYYNSNGQYVCNNNNCYYDQYNHYICNNNNGTLSVNLSNNGSSSVQPGAIVHSYITVYNNDGDQYVDITANLNNDLTYYSASISPDSHSDTQVVWDHVFIRSHSQLYMTLDTRVNSFAHSGDQIRLNVQAAGNQNTANDTEYMTVSY